MPPLLEEADAAGTIVPEESYRGVRFHGQRWPGARLEGSSIDGCVFEEVSLSGASLQRVIISDTAWRRVDLANMRALSCAMSRSSVEDGRLTGSRWTESRLSDVTFNGCKLHLSGFRFSTIQRTDFINCDLTQANFQGADLRKASFEGCDLTGAEFSAAQMDGTEFHHCRLLDIQGPLSFRGAVMDSEDLMSFSLSLANAVGIRLRFKE